MCKRFRTLRDDLEIFIEKELNLYHKLKIDNKGIFPIANLGIVEPEIFKSKKFACRVLKGKGAQSGIRVIHAYYKADDRIELIEIYYKGDKELEDRQRILRHFRK